MITVTYTEGLYVRVMEFDKPPAEVLEAVRSRLFPGVQPPAFDEKWERIMAARKA